VGGVDGNLIQEFLLIIQLIEQAIQENSYNQYTCNVHTDSTYECLDIAGVSTLSSSINQDINIINPNSTQWYTYGQQANISSTNLFGIATQCFSKTVGDGILNAHDLYAFAASMLQIPPYNVSVNTPTVNGRHATGTRCNTVSGQTEHIQDWLKAIILDECATEALDLECLPSSGTQTISVDVNNNQIEFDSDSTVKGIGDSHSFSVSDSNNAIKLNTTSPCNISYVGGTNTNGFYHGNFQVQITDCEYAHYISVHTPTVTNVNRLIYPCVSTSRRLQESNNLDLRIETASEIPGSGRWVKISNNRLTYSIEIVLQGLNYDSNHKLMLSNIPYTDGVAPNKYARDTWIRYERVDYQHLQNGQYDCQYLFGSATSYAMINNVIMVNQRPNCLAYWGIDCIEYQQQALCKFNLYVWIPAEDNNSPITITTSSSAMDGANGMFQLMNVVEDKSFTASAPPPPSPPPSSPCIQTHNVLIIWNTQNDISNFEDEIDTCHFNIQYHYTSSLEEQKNIVENNCMTDIMVVDVPYNPLSFATSVIEHAFTYCKSTNPTLKVISLRSQTSTTNADAYLGQSNREIGYDCGYNTPDTDIQLYISSNPTYEESELYTGLLQYLQQNAYTFESITDVHQLNTSKYTIVFSDALVSQNIQFKCGGLVHENVYSYGYDANTFMNALKTTLYSVINYPLDKSHIHSQILRTPYSQTNTNFVHLPILNNHFCQSEILTEQFRDSIEQCFHLCELTHNCKYMYWDHAVNLCKTHRTCRGTLVRDSIQTFDDIEDQIRTVVYSYSTRSDPGFARFSDIAMLLYGDSSSYDWNYVQEFTNNVSSDITTQFFQNVTEMASNIIQLCNNDMRIILNNPFEPYTTSFNEIESAIIYCNSNFKHIVMIQTVKQHIGVPFVGLNISKLSEKCAHVAIYNNETSHMSSINNINQTVFIYQNSSEYIHQETARLLQLQLQNIGVNASIASKNMITSSSYDTLIAMGINSALDLENEGVHYHMNCGDNMKPHIKHYGLMVHSQILASLDLIRNSTFRNNEFLKFETASIKIANDTTMNIINECDTPNSEFSSLGQMTWAMSNYVTTVANYSIESMSTSDLNRIASDFCIMNQDCNGYSINYNMHGHSFIHYTDHSSVSFQTILPNYKSCAFVKNNQYMNSIACTNNMSLVENIRYFIKAEEYEGMQYCNNNRVYSNDYVSSF